MYSRWLLRLINPMIPCRNILHMLVITSSLLLQPISSFTQITEQDDELPVTGIDSLNILLFEHQNPSQFTIYSYNGAITLTDSASFHRVMQPSEPGVTIKIDEDHLFINEMADPKKALLKRLFISNDEQSLIRIKVPGLSYRYYKGTLNFTFSKKDGIQIINFVGLENYIGSVIGGEMNFGSFEALKAQAVVSRNFALWNLSATRKTLYDLTDHSLSQVYRGELIMKPIFQKAAAATHGEILTWNNRLILAAYSSTCGGVTASSESVWNGKPLPYLRAVKTNGACRVSPHYRWNSSILKKDLHTALSDAVSAEVTGVEIGKTDKYGRVISLDLHLSSGEIEKIKANRFRMIVMKEQDQNRGQEHNYGKNLLKSTFFALQDDNNQNQKHEHRRYNFTGRGLGHGVGLCQWGASGLAKSGWNYKEILKFYYNGVELVNYHFFNSNFISRAN